jgi:[ribosomal protein S18]-alanine N-acetyltransferase
MTLFPKMALFAKMPWLRRRSGDLPAISPGELEDAARFAALHAASFRRGWSAEEFERLLIERNVVADRAVAGPDLAGFVVSRIAADQAEVLSIAVDQAFRGQGIARRMLDVHLRRLARYGVTVVFLEVDERNDPARRLYAGFGFTQVGRREAYYGGAAGAAALVLRRNLA